MSASIRLFFGLLVFTGYFVAPVTLVWGWARWTVEREPRTFFSIVSLIGFILATTSALLAVASAGYALTHGFRYYDPLLLRIFRRGFLLSLGGLLFGIGGVWRRSSLRWPAPISALGTLAFWVAAAAGE